MLVTRSRSGWLALAAFVALLTRVLVPAGFMPAGAMAVTICTASGLKTLMLDGDGHPLTPAKAHHDSPCAFSGLGALGPAPVALTPIGLVLLLLALRPLAPIPHAPARPRRLMPPAHAPPLMA